MTSRLVALKISNTKKGRLKANVEAMSRTPGLIKRIKRNYFLDF
ncbi:hypothetical protein Mcup_0996 [Metallosphaera cuprina Ar-4]|uniref:Uncharacterized protein n=1 Tax=Metallosphaera cuprina (strain Ar-4) TaxID=1006006 RepID=F4G2Q3_METCR|nr:hypothetical protein Mcup_0996 [Metallosphaera cuprina Ar-4]